VFSFNRKPEACAGSVMRLRLNAAKQACGQFQPAAVYLSAVAKHKIVLFCSDMNSPSLFA